MNKLLPFNLILLLIILSFSACVVVETKSPEDNSNNETTIYYYLPETLIKMDVKSIIKYNIIDNEIKNAEVFSQSFTLSTETIADTEQLYLLNYKPNIMMKDEISYFVNKKGLLDSLTTITDDRTESIIKNLTIPTDKSIRLSSTHGAENLFTVNNYQTSFLARDVIKKEFRDFDWDEVFKGEKTDKYGKIHCKLKIEINNKIATFSKKYIAQNQQKVNGIFIRPQTNLFLDIVSENGTRIPLKNIEIVDVNTKLLIPITRTLFAKKESRISFKDGMLEYNKITKPSSAEGFASIPINLAKAIMGIPAELIKVKFDNSKNALSSEKDYLEIKKELEDLKKSQEKINEDVDEVQDEVNKKQNLKERPENDLAIQNLYTQKEEILESTKEISNEEKQILLKLLVKKYTDEENKEIDR